METGLKLPKCTSGRFNGIKFNNFSFVRAKTTLNFMKNYLKTRNFQLILIIDTNIIGTLQKNLLIKKVLQAL